MASIVPVTGRDPALEWRATAEVATALAAAAAARDPAERGAALDRLDGLLGAHLAAHLFLTLRATPGGFRLRGVVLPGDGPAELGARLAAGGVAELFFASGVTRAELERLVAVLREPPPAVGATMATSLWDADLRCVRCRFTDENAAGPDDRLDAGRCAMVAPEGERCAAAARRPVQQVTPDGALPGHTDLEPVSRSILRLVRQVGGLATAGDGTGRAALGLLDELLEVLLRERHVPLLGEALAALETPALEAARARLVTTVHLLALGEALVATEPGSRGAAAVHDLLAALPDAVDRLCELLTTLDEMRDRQLVCLLLTLAAADDPAALARRADGEPWYVARNVAFVLGRIGGAGVVPHLARWARHADERVRVETARALGRVREPQAVEILGKMLDDEEPRVRQTAVWSLAELGDGRALRRLRAILHEDRAFRSRAAEERDDFFRTYGRLADAVAFDELVRLVDQRQLLGVGWPAELRRGAALALGETSRAEAARVLREHEHARDARLRQACVAGLRALRNRGVAAAFVHPGRDADDGREAVRPGAVFRLEVFDHA